MSASVGRRMRSGRYDTRRATGCQTKTCRRQTSIARASVLFSSLLLAAASSTDGEQRDPDTGSRDRVAFCLSRVASSASVFVPLARFVRQWARGPCICSIARASGVCPGNCPLRGSENASSECAPRDGPNRGNAPRCVRVICCLEMLWTRVFLDYE